MNEIRKLTKLDSYDFPGIGRKSFCSNQCEMYQTVDKKGVFLVQDGKALVFFPTELGIPAYYEFKPSELPEKIKAILMDLDGTSVKSEHFWIWIIEEVVRTITDDQSLKFVDADIPFVSGHSVSEHLNYALRKYCQKAPGANLPRARTLYFEIVNREMKEILAGRGRKDAFAPSRYLKEFLVNCKARRVKIGLVSSGLYEKAWPEIISAFSSINLGDPKEFYDAIVTAGFSIKKGQAGTLGELAPKPHPWLYAETLFGLNEKPEDAVGIEDSGAGILSIRSAGIAAIGVKGGNIEKSGTAPLCAYVADDLEGVWKAIQERI